MLLYVTFLVLGFVLSLCNGTYVLKCHDCTDKSCDEMVKKDLTGKCQTKPGGKCFIRQDPNGLTYRGCADQAHWPNLDYDYVGCKYQRYMAWDKKAVLWCFCDFDTCNTNTTYISHVYNEQHFPGHKPQPKPVKPKHTVSKKYGFPKTRTNILNRNPPPQKLQNHNQEYHKSSGQENHYQHKKTYDTNQQQKAHMTFPQKPQQHYNNQNSFSKHHFQHQQQQQQPPHYGQNQQPYQNQAAHLNHQQTQQYQQQIHHVEGMPQDFRTYQQGHQQGQNQVDMLVSHSNPATSHPVQGTPQHFDNNQHQAQQQGIQDGQNQPAIFLSHFNPAHQLSTETHGHQPIIIVPINPPADGQATAFNGEAKSGPNSEAVADGSENPAWQGLVNTFMYTGDQSGQANEAGQMDSAIQHQANNEAFGADQFTDYGDGVRLTIEEGGVKVYYQGQGDQTGVLQPNPANVGPVSDGKKQPPFQTCASNQVFKQCGSACTATCDNYKHLICTRQCVARCECPQHAPIWHNNQCIAAKQCPSKSTACASNQVFKQCGSACTATCDNYKHLICTRQCVERCECPQHAPIWHNNQCIATKQCSSKSTEQQCQSNQVWNSCGKECTATCDNYKTLMCSRKCTPRCECPYSTPLWQNGRCISIAECPANGKKSHQGCTGGQVFMQCGSACTRTCDNHNSPCTLQCVQRCQCPPRKPVWFENKCIILEQCPVKSVGSSGQGIGTGSGTLTSQGQNHLIASQIQGIIDGEVQGHFAAEGQQSASQLGQNGQVNMNVGHGATGQGHLGSVGGQVGGIQGQYGMGQAVYDAATGQFVYPQVGVSGQFGAGQQVGASGQFGAGQQGHFGMYGIEGKQGPDTNAEINMIGSKKYKYGKSKVCSLCEHTCNKVKGKYVCGCHQGYVMNKNGYSCSDVNECLDNNGGCSHTCENTQGGYLCKCPAGYSLSDDGKSCIDIDECQSKGNNCEQACINTAGSYRCACQPGFTLHANGRTCDDKNECNLKTHGCEHYCLNTRGSFSCRCMNGYELAADGKSCTDANECLIRNGDCEHMCVNIPGNRLCECSPGYILQGDGRSCLDIDECQTNNAGCDQLCINTEGTYQCSCRSGYVISADHTTCFDINECRDNNGGCEQLCENTEGAYHCACRPGYRMGNDKLSCFLEDTCQVDNGGCDHICERTEIGHRCTCREGYLLDKDGATCVDEDECLLSNGGCTQLCINTVGGFTCACDPGYDLGKDGRICLDIDECLNLNGGCSDTCENTPGSYRCTCPYGYTYDHKANKCRDLNECENDNGGCSDRCINTVGSYYCECQGDLFTLAEDGRSCVANCPKGYTKSDSLQSCYRVYQNSVDTRSRKDAQWLCQEEHPLSGLVSIETEEEKNFLGNLLSANPSMLDGWQGWWTSGRYIQQVNQFQWRTGAYIANDSPLWGFQRTPFKDTCVWILQISVYNYTIGNYDCGTVSGFVCEINLPQR